nr:SMP-30/gluconolactonase/LRE family protein [Roseomonas haemaphysalidis]
MWSASEQALYWIDIKKPELRRYNEGTGEEQRWPLPSQVGAFALTMQPKGALLALRDGLKQLDFATGAIVDVAPPPYDATLFRFNDGACDPKGRFFVGVTFEPIEGDGQPKKASLHSFTLRGGLRRELDISTQHNGIAWSPTGSHFYLAHSNDGEIWRYHYDPANGRLNDPEIFAHVAPEVGVPDGAAVDAEGCYWCALYGSGRLRRYRPDGVLDREIALPVSQPTMCAFGGQDLGTLYVTSAAEGLDPQTLEREPHAGGLFRFRPGVKGTAPCAYVR